MNTRAWAWAWALAACAPLDPIPESVCGNQVLERDRGEDCDTFASADEVAPSGVTLACGAAETPRACLYTCDAGTGAGCPIGWACGAVDGVCRRAQLSYTALAPSGVGFDPQDVSFADFDGNGLHDLAFFSGSDMVVHFATGAGGFGAEYYDALGLAGLGRRLGVSVAVGAVDDDGRADLVAPTAQGALVLLGTAGRALEPKPFPSRVLRTAGDVVAVLAVEVPGQLEQEALVFVSAPGATFLVAPRTMDTTLLRLNDPPGELTRVTAVADLDGDLGSELVVAYQGGQAVHAVTLGLTSDDKLQARDFDQLRLPAPLDGPVALADVDRDGDADLVAYVRTPEGHRVAVAEYQPGPQGGLGRFGVAQVVQWPAITDVAGVALSTSDLGPLLAVADVNNDQRADFVFASGVLGGGAPRGVVVFSYRDEQAGVDGYLAWPLTPDVMTEVVVADLNRDGAPDIASTGTLPGINIALGSGFGAFNPSRIDSAASASTLRVGDFDGDFVNDLVFLEGASLGAPTLAAAPIGELSTRVKLWVAFGRLQGAPGTPVLMGEIPQPIALTPARDDRDDLITDLWSVSVQGTAQGPTSRDYALYSFSGAADRRLRAALGVAGRGSALAGVWLGQFDDDPGDDLLSWALPTQATAGNTMGRRALWGMSRQTLAAGATTETGHLLDFASTDEKCNTALADAAEDTGRAFSVLPLARAEGAGVARDTLVGFRSRTRDDEADTLALTLHDVSIATRDVTCSSDKVSAHGFGDVQRAYVVDLDRDGETDLLLVQGTQAATGQSAVTVRYGARLQQRDSGVGLRLTDRHVGVLQSALGEPIVDIAVADLDLDGHLDVITTGLFGTTSVARQTAPRELGPLQSLGGDFFPVGDGVRAPEPIATLPGLATTLTRVFAEDFNGDRLVDVVVVQGRSIQAYAAVPVGPGGRGVDGLPLEAEPVEARR
jgi:hypothetical protein